MACYNDESYIEISINSILKQTYTNIELIIVDDFSRDNTLSIIYKYKNLDNRIIVIKNKKNIGLTKSLNKAIKLARGDYIARHDADDFSDKNRIIKQLKYIKKSYSQIVGSYCYLVDEKNDILKLKRKPTSSIKIKRSLLYKNCIIHGSTLIDFKIVGKDFYYDEKYIYSQDYELWSRLSLKYKIENINEPLYFLRIHKKSISSAKAFDQLKFSKKVAFRNLSYNRELYFFKILIFNFYYIIKFFKITFIYLLTNQNNNF